MEESEEARRLFELFRDQPAQLVNFLSGQLSVVKEQVRMLVGLCGLTVTVTGFSGAHMIRAGTISSIAMVIGIVLVLVGLMLSLRIQARLRWVSQDLADDLTITAQRSIERRNREQRNTLFAGIFVALGLGAYLVAVILAALVNGTAPR